MRNKLFIDFFREISRNFGRFISIFFIVLLGTAFFAGLRSSGGDMRISADSYYDDTRLMDIKLLNTLGFTDEDLQDFRKVKDVELVEGGLTKEVLIETGKSELVLRLIAITKGINEPYLLSGRLPKKIDECLVDLSISKFVNYKIGDKITINRDDDVKTTTFTITGFCHLPYYEEIVRGTTTVGDGSIDAFLVIPRENFTLKAYTESYIRVKGVASINTYSDEYKEKINLVKKDFEKLENKIKTRRYENVLSEANDKVKKAERKIKKAEKKLSDAEKKINSGRKKLNKGKRKIQSKKRDIYDAEVRINNGREKLRKATEDIRDGRIKLDEKRELLSNKEEELENAEIKLKKGEGEFNHGREKLNKKLKEYKSGLEKYNSGLLKYNEGLKQYEAGEKAFKEAYTKLEFAEKNGMAQPELRAKLEAERTRLEATKLKLQETKIQLEASKTGLDAGKTAVDKATSELNKRENELNEAKEKIEAGREKLKEGQNTINEKEKDLEEAESKLNSEKARLLKSSKELLDGKEKLRKAKNKLAENKAKFDKEFSKFQGKRPDALREIKKGRRKLKDAKKDILNIEKPDFYVLDRDKMEGYVNFKQNAERMDSIGNVFPVIFFLVAALVSLTAMTRMVDESRMSMGILKALGFNFAILGKYLAYCLLATVTGSIIGIAIGERFLPVLIIKSYGILFTGMPYCLTPLNLKQALLAILAATLSTVLATLISAIRQLFDSPAALMRPLPPPSGRRVFLEKLGIIWKHLNFTQKSTVRNLARYKKRLLMTVIGIGGCMGLLLVGFGLRDSIQEIAKKQYVKIFTYTASATINSKASEKEKEDFANAVKKNNLIKESIRLELVSVNLTKKNKTRNTIMFVPEKIKEISNFLTLKNRITGERFDFPQKGAYISEKTAKMLGAKEGDTIKIRRDGKENSIKIEKIVENYVFHYLFIAPETYKEIYGKAPEYNTVYIKHKTKNEEKLGEELLSHVGCSGVNFVDELQENIDKMLNVLNLVIFVLISSAGLLAFVVLYNLNSINILERKREIATLKVLGFYDGEVASYIYRENMLLTLIGIAFGLAFGSILHQYVIQTVEVDLMMFGRKISIISYILSSIITLAFSLAVNIVMYFTLKKIDMTTSLKSVE